MYSRMTNWVNSSCRRIFNL